MVRRHAVRIVCGFLLVSSCGRATVRDQRRVELVITGVSFDATSVTVLARHASCASAFERVTVTANDEPTRACLRGLADGSKAELVERRLQFKLMTCGSKPSVMNTLGACSVPRDAMRVEHSGQPCSS